MFKKIDKLIIRAYLGPFFLTLGIVIFILLVFTTLQRFKYFVGKDLGFEVFAEFYYYFALVSVPTALPLAVLLSSLMTFGSLGEHSELTAIKSAGISLLRILRPVLFLVLLITAGAIWFNDQVVPYANLKAYSLFYDIKQKKPVLEFKDEVFYTDLPGFSIKISKKMPDGKTLQGVMIYDHTKRKGNTQVLLAESGEMSLSPDGQRLDMKLKKGNVYIDVSAERGVKNKSEFARSRFDSTEFSFDLNSYGLPDTKEELFMGHNLMKTSSQIKRELDSLKALEDEKSKAFEQQLAYKYHYSSDTSLATVKPNKRVETEKINPDYSLYSNAAGKAVGVKTVLESNIPRMRFHKELVNSYEIDLHRKFTDAISIFFMFLIGAPLGAIIKKGGLGVPVLVSIVFFIIYYIAYNTGYKYARQGILEPVYGCWVAHFMLFWFGLFFMRQAYLDARLFEVDYYYVLLGKVKGALAKKQ